MAADVRYAKIRGASDPGEWRSMAAAPGMAAPSLGLRPSIGDAPSWRAQPIDSR
ncbi:hypothetical protein [Rhizobium sp. AN80A]|uniref:hypothetical protein n=1 Tax=Rhizobium sp. AN80A TaxID=3040673 RepID=UPI0024B39C48|nr:hypothetical protein [Rhizobium sp. AN80A]